MHGFDSTQMAPPSASGPFERRIKSRSLTSANTGSKRNQTPELASAPSGSACSHSQQSINVAVALRLLSHLHKSPPLKRTRVVETLRPPCLRGRRSQRDVPWTTFRSDIAAFDPCWRRRRKSTKLLSLLVINPPVCFSDQPSQE